MPKKKFTITVEADLAHAEFPTWYNFHGNDEVASNETSAADFSYYVQQVIISELIADGISRQDLEEFLQVVRPEKPEKEVFDGHFDGVSIPPSDELSVNLQGYTPPNPTGIIDTCASEPDEDAYIDAHFQAGLDKALEADDE